MPRVKIDYVVSFSSEDPENPANNLLAREVSKRKWLCKTGETSSSVVLQLARAVKISAVHIGAYNAAMVEVLVGRSEKPDEPFEVLVPSSVFVSVAEARRGAAQRVRSFRGEQLARAAAQRWDRLRLVCSQPYNKHQYGISFIHVDEPGEVPEGRAAVTSSAVPARLLNVDAAASEDEDEFRPGELFAQHLQRAGPQHISTESQIRRASSQAMNNMSDSTPRLARTHHHAAHKHTPRDDPQDKLTVTSAKQNPEKNNKEKTETSMKAKDLNKGEQRSDKSSNSSSTNRVATVDKRSSNSRDIIREFANSSIDNQDCDRKNIDKNRNSTSNNRDKCGDTRDDARGKRRRSKDQTQTDDDAGSGPGPRCSEPLRGVVFALSGYQNPWRADLRHAALRLGARYRRDWTPDCTHLVCAFPNTPKLQQLRASGGGGGGGAVVPAVSGTWVVQCAALRRRVPWRWHAVEPRYRVTPPPDIPDHSDHTDGSERDTDDEIEETLRKQKKQRRDSLQDSSQHAAQHAAQHTEQHAAHDDSDVVFVRDERLRGHVTLHDSDSDHTDCDQRQPSDHEMDDSKSLPNFFEGYTFCIEESESAAVRLRRYVRAYGGLLVHDEADYVVRSEYSPGRSGVGGGRVVSPSWVWACHRRRGLLPPH